MNLTSSEAITGSISYPVTIDIKGLNHYFGHGDLKKQVLYEIDLSIASGEIVLLTGPSGSGKTTLLTLLGGLRSAHEGSLKILGQEMRGATKNQLLKTRCNIGYIFQAHNLLSFLSARQNVRLSLELHDHYTDADCDRLVDEMLTAVGLGDRLDYYPDQLSGGQKQRVAIARALVSSPKIILADEPTAALDRKSGRDVVEIIQKLAKERHCTILLVTHDNRILDIADRLLYMEDGRLVKDKTE